MTSTAAPASTGMRSSPDATRPSGVMSGSVRGTDDFASAERHSRRVRALKLALPALGVMIAGGFAGFSYLATPPTVAMEVAGTAVREGKLVMANPKLDGFTEDNLPYSMTAARAIQDVSQTGVIKLEEMSAKLPVEEGNFAVITAPEGVYDRDKNTLDIPSEMTVSTTDGVEVRFQSAAIDMGAGTLKTEQPVDIRLGGSRIAAQSLTVSEGGKVFLFEDKVRVEIDRRKLETARTATTGGIDAKN